MKIGIQIPNAEPGVTGATILDWARRADAGPFASLGAADRLRYQSFDALVGLAAAAAVTERIEIISLITIAPLRAPAVFAKEAASLAVLAQDRFTLGVGVGARATDYATAGVDWAIRGRLLDECLAAFAETQTPVDAPQCVGPNPGDVPILIGGASPPAMRRLATVGAGFVGGGLIPGIFGQIAGGVRAVWAGAGREGSPRLVAGTWFASTPEVADRGAKWRHDYFVQGGPPAEICEPIHTGADAVRGAVEAFGAAGADELVFFPVSDDIGELEWLADLHDSLI